MLCPLGACWEERPEYLSLRTARGQLDRWLRLFSFFCFFSSIVSSPSFSSFQNLDLGSLPLLTSSLSRRIKLVFNRIGPPRRRRGRPRLEH